MTRARWRTDSRGSPDRDATRLWRRTMHPSPTRHRLIDNPALGMVRAAI